ncbi:MAG: hypothetical protein OEX02_21450, partial [Cyclobacteriaceae bacterium]|nr:hypothetical protein [Cyclobacteriaceae bacterium]
TVNDLFDKYYFNDEDISLRELVGVQYSNDAIYRIDDEDYKGAFAQLEKAWLFYPGEKIKYMLLSTGTQILTLNSYDKDPDLLGYLIKLSRYKELGITTEMVVGEFGKITEQLLLNNGQSEKYKRYYEELIAELDDQETIDEISFGYYYESGRVLYNDGHFSASLPYFEEAFTLKPGNLNVKSAFTNTLLQLGNAKRNNNELLEFVEKYSNKYTQLEKNGKFIHLMATAYLTAFMQSYQLNNTVEGDHYKKLFEELFQANPDMHLPVDKVAEAYSAAAVYYFRKGQKVRARQYIDDGLKVIPGNFELQQRQRMLR